MGCKFLKLVTWPWPRPFQGRFIISRLVMVWLTHPPNLKSVVSHVTQIWNVAKCKNWEFRNSYRSPKVIVNVTIWYSAYDILLVFNRNYASILYLEIWWVIHRNSTSSTYPTCIWRPCWEWHRSNFKKNFGTRKLESLRYHAALFVRSYLVQLRLVTVTQTYTGP